MQGLSPRCLEAYRPTRHDPQANKVSVEQKREHLWEGLNAWHHTCRLLGGVRRRVKRAGFLLKYGVLWLILSLNTVMCGSELWVGCYYSWRVCVLLRFNVTPCLWFDLLYSTEFRTCYVEYCAFADEVKSLCLIVLSEKYFWTLKTYFIFQTSVCCTFYSNFPFSSVSADRKWRWPRR